MTDVSERGPEFINDLGDAMRRNPISTALIGMGLVWLFAGRKAGLIPEAATEAFNTSAANSAAEAIRDADIPGVETISSNTADFFQNMRGNLGELFDAQPLALGAVGLLIGAGIAAGLPQTDLENAYLGETSDTVRNKVTETVREQVDG